MERLARNGWIRAAMGLLAALALVTPGFAQPTFGGPRPKPKPGPDGKPVEPARPGKTPAPEVTQPPEEWSQDDAERKDPNTEGAKPGEWYCWKTTDGLRYAWSLPAKYEQGKSYDLVVMMHPERMDFRWGPSNHLRADDGFRPDCICVSVDGMAANARRPELRSFESTPENCVRFRDVLLEFTRNFPMRHMILYGEGEGAGGGQFAAYFSAAFPALTDGVLDHGGGIKLGSAAKSNVPMVFMHGAKDSVTPLSTSMEAVKAYQDAGNKGVRLRILREFNDFPNSNCASDCVDYLRGLRTESPEEAVEVAKRLLTLKGTDEYGYRAPPWFSGAMDVLARLDPDGASPYKFEKPASPETRKKADALIDKVEKEGEANAASIRTLLKASDMEKGDFILDGGPWLGYMLAVRDDFRGVKSVEKLAAELKLDEKIAAHAEQAQDLLTTWRVSGSEADKFARAVDSITSCFLYEPLPVDMIARCRACMRKADELEIDAESRDRFEFLQLWEQGWKEGLDAYEQRWQNWDVDDASAK